MMAAPSAAPTIPPAKDPVVNLPCPWAAGLELAGAASGEVTKGVEGFTVRVLCVSPLTISSEVEDCCVPSSPVTSIVCDGVVEG